MPVKPVPEGFHTVTPYLVVKGVVRLIEFLKAAFDAVELERTHDSGGRVMHAMVRIGDSVVMMGETIEGFPPMPCSLYLYVPDTDAVYRQAIAAGGVSLMEPADQFYGDRNAGVLDQSGNKWWIATHIEDMPSEELARRARERR
jgi:uncharacterized glyoxalase superfamily protein PhnB